jgi:acetyl-CoA carboxylase/biotin carboxylase 1
MTTQRKGLYAAAAAALLVSSATSFAPQHSAFTPSSLSTSNQNGFGQLKSAFFHKDVSKASSTALSTATLDETSLSSADSTASKVEDYVKSRGGNRVIRKVLIANNGMAATKSILSMRQWAYMEFGDERAIQFVAMATPEDLKANAQFIRLADSFVEVPGGKNSNNYANVEVITKIAKEQGVDAVWPGWGHASENPKLPNTLDAMGIKFIGPTGPVMSVLGDKIAANILAQTAEVPSIPWSGSFGGPDDGPLQANLNAEGTIPDEIFQKGLVTSADEAVEAANKIGWENGIMIKASEGGGGKGIRFVDNEADLRNAFVQVTNEVVGSPIFLMQLCKNARHIEVQIVGDQHGNAVALNGRDCSTQRRFQKIFEEGPPVIVPKETFHEMELAAQRLTQNIGYQGAGTVEYLYNAADNKFFFLELNPRLQVEHPVTEGITDVNLPATQLQVAMGIPLYNIPQIRRLYGKTDAYGSDPIDFLEERYRDIDTHVIAARITAENPDEGFKPTSGSIERIKFQSTPNVWGYFSVGSNGGIHEFADSQFGHLFAKGPNREEARKALVLALKEMEVRGDIRNSVEYLVKLLETDDFKKNTIDTSWLDGIIKEKSVTVDMQSDLVVVGAAVFKAFEHVRTATEEVKESFSKGQVSTSGIPGINSFNIEVAYADTKYPFHVERISPDVYRFTLNGNSLDVEVTLTAEGALLATFGGETHRIIGMDEPLGLRLSMDGNTILMPTIFDPSELRTDVTGKVVRYLQDNGASVEAGQPYVEVEAMKMIMPIKATESGKITHNLSPGSVISAGDLLASLELKDPSKVKKIETFSGQLEFEETTVDMDPKKAAMNVLAGFNMDPEKVAQQAMDSVSSSGEAADLLVEILNEFYRVESQFEGVIEDEVVRTLTKANAENLDVVISENLAHQQLKTRGQLVLAMIRQLDIFSERFGQEIPASLIEALQQVASLKNKGCGEIVLAAEERVRLAKVPAFEVRLDELKKKLTDQETDLIELSKSSTLSAGVDLLTNLLGDEDDEVRKLAMEVYTRRVYRTYEITDLTVGDEDGRLSCSFSFQFSDVPEKDRVTRQGFFSVINDASKFAKELPAILNSFGSKISGDASKDGPTNVLQIGALSGDISIEELEEAHAANKDKLNMLGIRTVTALITRGKKDPSYYSFPQCSGFKEDPLRRGMRPTFHHLLELGRLEDNFNLERIPAMGRNAQIYVGTEKNARRNAAQVVFLRAISHTPGLTTFSGARRALLAGLDELERAQSNSKVNPQSSSRIYLHSLPEQSDASPQEIAKEFDEVIDKLKTKLARRLTKLRVDEIETKVRVTSTDEDGNSVVVPVRLVASSMQGEWLKTSAYIDRPDPVTGVTRERCVIGDGVDEVCELESYDASNTIQTKRAIARRVGSTYAYDYLGLLEVSLIEEWEKYISTLSGPNTPAIPANVFEAEELLEDADGELVTGKREIGTNKVGMVAWKVTMKTPEYPEGREVVVIANDVTVGAGSFGVEEDEIFYKASKYARENKIPRVYIACNSGARIGLVDDLKPKFQIKFIDEASPSKGFEYLYLDDATYKSLPEGSVNVRQVPEGWAITDIIGTNEGIGVENLQGSGKIAGETSRAYDEIFTLSYVTGRSVGIGAYLVRLGQRIIQKNEGPMLLTGFGALNKLLGRNVYNSNDQLGGPQVMYPNGCSHEIVQDDQEGVSSIIQWLSFVPKTTDNITPVRESADPVNRKVEWRPTPTPYDPRHMLTGADGKKGFFDEGSFKEYLGGWGKSVAIGRGRLGGIPMGAITVETRLVEKIIPADPADPNSREAVMPQAGQVLFPDSSYKTAQALRDFNNEGLPVMIFANWRGFSGGSRDMSGEILKFGSMIVDALREYKHPIYIYFPPHGELRGGSWVVVDPTINEDKMTMFSDPDARGGILEPAGIVEIKFRLADQLKAMHRIDPQLKMLDAELESTDDTDVAAQEAIKEQISAREELLKPVYLQAATEFADLHDKTGRMKAKGVIKEAVAWEDSREYFFYLAKRRIAQDNYVSQLTAADSSLDAKAAVEVLKGMCSADWDDNKAVLEYYSSNDAAISAKIGEMKTAAIKAQIEQLQKALGE